MLQMPNQSFMSTQGQQGQNQIKNPQAGVVPRVKGPQANDRDFLNDALAREKYLTDNLTVFAREASHRALHNDVMRILNETHAMARELFNLMFRKGWYTLEAEQPQKLAQTAENYTNYQTQFPYTSFVQ